MNLRFTKKAAAKPALSAAAHVKLARHPQRPDVDVYINGLFTDFFEQCGDRLAGDDFAICGGVALFHGTPVTIIGQRKGTTLAEKMRSHFGMPSPEGYRKACRLMAQAEKFGRPIITFINTAGAYPASQAEERGQGDAIAKSIAQMSMLSVPVIAIVTGEGGSGGALALGVANRVVMLEHAVYSILSPEGFASILWKDASRADEACALMKLTAHDLKQGGIIDHIINEPDEGVHQNPLPVLEALDKYLQRELRLMHKKTGATLAQERYEKFRKIGTDTPTSVAHSATKEDA